jgi:hypothetical protein
MRIAPRLAQRLTGAVILAEPGTKAVAKRRLEVRQSWSSRLVVHSFSGALTTDVIAENVIPEVLLEVADTQAERLLGLGAPLLRSHGNHLAPPVFVKHPLIGMPFLPPSGRVGVQPRDHERLWIDGEMRTYLRIHAGVVGCRLIVRPTHHHIEGVQMDARIS